MDEEFKAKFLKAKLESSKQRIMTVQELFDKFKVLIDQGHGDAMIEVDDNFGGYYALSKNAKVELESTEQADVHGKWIYICND